MSIEVEGVEKVLDLLDKLGSEEKYEGNLIKACSLVEADAKRTAPKDTGALRRSIESRIEEQGNELKGIVFTNLDYAPYVEYGTGLFAEKGGRSDVPWVYVDDKGEGHRTSGQKPQPYMRPALLNNKQKILDLLKEAVKS